jgi:hypothetical protein
MPFGILATNDKWIGFQNILMNFLILSLLQSFALIDVNIYSFTNSNFDVLVKQRIWNINNKCNVSLNI